MAEEFPMDIELLADSPEMGQTDFSPDPYELGLVSGDKATEGTEDRTACTCATCGKVSNVKIFNFVVVPHTSAGLQLLLVS